MNHTFLRIAAKRVAGQPLLLLGACLLMMVSCQRNTDDNRPPDPTDVTIPPASTPVTTTATIYFEGNNQTSDPVNISINQTPTTYNAFGYSTAVFNGDAYDNTLRIEHTGISQQFFVTNRTVTLTGSKRNYIDAYNKVFKTLVSVQNTVAGQVSLPGGGRLIYEANNFGNNGGATNSLTDVGFAAPNAVAFALKVPSFTADFDNKRWFLKNYGTYYIGVPNIIDPAGNVRLALPIQQNMLAGSPDSIDTWLFRDKVWIRKGHAKKIGNEYLKRIDQAGIWAFAAPVNGLYTTLKVRTDAGLPITNAIVRLKNTLQQEVAAARTDMDGNAVCFVPANETLTADILQWWSMANAPVHTQTVNPLTASADRTVTLPTTTNRLVSLKGTAKDCNGANIQSGSVVVKERSGFIRAHLPIANGAYGGGFLAQADREIFLLKIVSEPTGNAGSDTAISLRTGMENTVQLNTSAPATNLYAHYSIDGINHSLLGDAASASPLLGAYPSFTHTMIVCNSNGQGFEFSSSPFTTGTFTGAGVSNLWVNGMHFNHDTNKPVILTYTRYDLLPGGYIIGSVDLYYKDGNASRHLVAHFKVKRYT